MDFLRELTNYDIKKFLIVIFSIQVALIGSIAMDFLNLTIPILRQVIGFVYLTFVPGIVIHRTFRLHKLTSFETFACIIGLSILFLIFTGFFMNSFYYFYALKPISVISLVLTTCTIVSVLSLLCYLRDKDTSTEIFLNNTKYSISLPLLFLCIIPFLGIFGGNLRNFYHTNILLVVNIIFISILLFLIIFTDFMPKRLYPLAIFVISISILYQSSLTSTYLDGWDIQYEYHYANLVVTNSLWNTTLPSQANAMLSIVMLAPIYSKVCNLELTYVFKIIYPFLYSIIPLTLYHIYQKQVRNENIAFLSVFYFVSIYTFSTEMLALARQQIGELFFVLIFLIVFSDLETIKKKTLTVLFMLCMVTSHYGLSYLALVLMPASYLFRRILFKDKDGEFTVSFMVLFFVFAITWYIYLSNGSAFNAVIEVFTRIYKELITGFSSSTSFELATSTSASLSGQILKIQYLISQFFIVIGLIRTIIMSKNSRISKEYLTFSLTFLCVLISSILISATGMNIHRLYHITSIFLSTFCVIGCIFIIQMIYNRLYDECSNKSLNKSLKIAAVFFVTFMIVNIGVSQQLLNNNQISVFSKKEHVENSDNIEYKYQLYKTHFPSQDVISTKWLSKNRNLQTKIYADFSSIELLFFSYGMISEGGKLLTSTNKIEPSSYVYLRYPNTHYGLFYTKNGMNLDIADELSALSQKNLIYSNQDDFIYQF